jgi:hypothetical protein
MAVLESSVEQTFRGVVDFDGNTPLVPRDNTHIVNHVLS